MAAKTTPEAMSLVLPDMQWERLTMTRTSPRTLHASTFDFKNIFLKMKWMEFGGNLKYISK